MTAYETFRADTADYLNTYDYYENHFTLPKLTFLTDEDVGLLCKSMKSVMSEIMQ